MSRPVTIGSVSFLNAKPLIWGLDESRRIDLQLDVPSRVRIGDKAVCQEPPGLPYQLDLGEEWKRLTGMPFVFAAWTAAAGVALGSVPQHLERAKKNGLAHIDQIILRHALPSGWPADV